MDDIINCPRCGSRLTETHSGNLCDSYDYECMSAIIADDYRLRFLQSDLCKERQIIYDDTHDNDRIVDQSEKILIAQVKQRDKLVAELKRQLDIETKALVIMAGMLVEYVDPKCTDENDKQWAIDALVISSRADANTEGEDDG